MRLDHTSPRPAVPVLASPNHTLSHTTQPRRILAYLAVLIRKNLKIDDAEPAVSRAEVADANE